MCHYENTTITKDTLQSCKTELVANILGIATFSFIKNINEMLQHKVGTLY